MQKMTILSILLREKLGDAKFFSLGLNQYREALEETKVLEKVQTLESLVQVLLVESRVCGSCNYARLTKVLHYKAAIIK